MADLWNLDDYDEDEDEDYTGSVASDGSDIDSASESEDESASESENDSASESENDSASESENDSASESDDSPISDEESEGTPVSSDSDFETDESVVSDDSVTDEEYESLIRDPQSVESVISDISEKIQSGRRKRIVKSMPPRPSTPKRDSPVVEKPKKKKVVEFDEGEVKQAVDRTAKLQERIVANFSQFFINPRGEMTMEELCGKKDFQLQPHQVFAASYITEHAIRMLINAGIGSGKTCEAIRILESNITNYKPLFVVPASLRPNVYKELVSQCAGDRFITAKNRQILAKEGLDSVKGKKIWEDSIKRIDKEYKIVSYHGFMKLLADSKSVKALSKYLIIIDEVQNIISEKGKMYKEVLRFSSKHPDIPMVFMSATPIFDHPRELGLAVNLLKPNTFDMAKFDRTFIDVSDPDNPRLQNRELLQSKLGNLFMYYAGAPKEAYPNVKQELVECEMSKFQRKVYSNYDQKQKRGHGITLPNDFFINTRIASNFVYPNGDIKGTFAKSDLQGQNLAKYSCKGAKFLKRVSSIKGPQLAFTNFTKANGVTQIEQLLKANGWKKYGESGSGPRYTVFTGSEKDSEKAKVVSVFNDLRNRDGSQLKLVIGSPSMKEGVSFLGVQAIHIFDLYWNEPFMQQVKGRGIRFCSHVHLSESERTVTVYMYLAVSKHIDMTTDQHLYSLSNRKFNLVKQFNDVIRSVAVDCLLFKNANGDVECLGKIEDTRRVYETGGVDSPRVEKDLSDLIEKKIHTPRSIRVEDKKKKSTAGTCPKARRPVEGICSKTHPFQYLNKDGEACCYARPSKVLVPTGKKSQEYSVRIDSKRGILINNRKCEGYTKDELDAIMKKMGYKAPAGKGKRSATKKMICETLTKPRQR